jgi:hypothetical protein
MKQDLRDKGRIVLAYGEATGHCHEVVIAETGAPPDLAQAQFFEMNGQRELIVLAPCILRHHEHAPIALDPSRQEQVRQGDILLMPLGPGAWRVVQQQEWAGPERWHVVKD